MPVVNFPEPNELCATLSTLYELAKRGELDGLLFVTYSKTKQGAFGGFHSSDHADAIAEFAGRTICALGRGTMPADADAELINV